MITDGIASRKNATDSQRVNKTNMRVDQVKSTIQCTTSLSNLNSYNPLAVGSVFCAEIASTKSATIVPGGKGIIYLAPIISFTQGAYRLTQRGTDSHEPLGPSELKSCAIHQGAQL